MWDVTPLCFTLEVLGSNPVASLTEVICLMIAMWLWEDYLKTHEDTCHSYIGYIFKLFYIQLYTYPGWVCLPFFMDGVISNYV
jgi:hypothetical protein